MNIAVVGGGFAGLAAAVELAAHGHAPQVFEASATLGGRARTVQIHGLRLDNGPHLLLGAYRETLRLMRLVGANPDALGRQPLQLEIPGQFRLTAPKLPAPWHLLSALLRAGGLTFTDKLTAINFMRRQQSRQFRLSADITVAALLTGHSANLCQKLWYPLCLAALNTAPEQASGQVFLNVLRDSLAGDRQASDMLLPSLDLSEIFPEPAAKFLVHHGGSVFRHCRIHQITRRESSYWLDAHGPFDQLVVAIAPQHLGPLIDGLPELSPLAATLAAFRYEPIYSVYLQYPTALQLPSAMLGLWNGPGQWLFDRERLAGQTGLVAVVISGAGPHQAISHEALAQQVHQQLHALLPQLAPPLWCQVIAERRAAFACTPKLNRPDTKTPLPGLWLAGDYVAGDYPATIEGAVRSGVNAARCVLADEIA